ncbi:hypothetical protein [sulfur-oxidizing endosymbiont of Gigantopelta aegis]|uniref:hypothetical protein n=1 Tax=sulfur-oxidizing endosymbiont of Gigantopelta aegis TaxID=2794934 RepID=UPI0018DDEABD|nr:hypothetical protein [sulfur-oxidizing endosymbiont of Gigantopelta aegis]
MGRFIKNPMTEKITAGATLASMRKKELKKCVVCREEFLGLKRAKFCSNKCKQKDKYQRSKLKEK